MNNFCWSVPDFLNITLNYSLQIYIEGCKELDHPRAGVLHCDENDNEQNCTISCQEGFEFSQAVTSYQCGPSTNYQWSHESIDNPAAILPGCTSK